MQTVTRHEMEEKLNALRQEAEQHRQANALLDERVAQQTAALRELNERLVAQEAQNAQARRAGQGEEIVQQVVQALQAGGDRAVRLKPLRPPIFSGDSKGDVDEWLFRVEQYFVTANTQEERRVTYAASLLSGSAASWWRAQWESNARSPTCTQWEAFKEGLNTQFKFMSANVRAREELYTVPVHAFKEMSEYCRFFRNKVLQTGGMSDEEQVFAFCRMLNPQMRADVMSKRPSNLNDCMHTAEVIAAAQREWRNPMGARRGPFKKRNRFQRMGFNANPQNASNGQGTHS